MVKRIVAVVLSLSIVAALSACGANGELSFPGKRNVSGAQKGQENARSWVK